MYFFFLFFFFFIILFSIALSPLLMSSVRSPAVQLSSKLPVAVSFLGVYHGAKVACTTSVYAFVVLESFHIPECIQRERFHPG